MSVVMSDKGTECLRFMYRFLSWLPVVVINGIAVWSYFAYVIILCIDTVHSSTEKALYLVFYHPLFLMFMYTYWKAIMCDAGQVPMQFQLSRQDRESYDRAENPQEVINTMARGLPILTTNINGAVRFCEPCQQIKPDRCHHCSMCHRCILKMDHHCPWINNCVGFGNYKFFFLFLFYAILYTMYVTFTSLKYFLNFWTGKPVHADSSLHIMFLFFIAAMFCISLWSLFGYHVFLVLHNRTTLESFRAPLFAGGPDKNGFNLGKSNNFRQVFGNNKLVWFLPIFSGLGNGHSFPLGNSRNPESEGLLGNSRVLHINGDQEENHEENASPIGYTEYDEVGVDSDRDSDHELKVTELLVSERLPIAADNRDQPRQIHPL